MKISITEFPPGFTLKRPLELPVYREEGLYHACNSRYAISVLSDNECGLAVKLKEQVAMLWREYGQAPDETLSPANKALKYRLNFLLKDRLFDYKHCRVCGGDVSEPHETLARRNITDAICGPACYAQERLNRVACCELARQVHCVCDIKTECPIHGSRCFGTHD